MNPIKILDTHTINKIAAGEVVERPASVVKELVENSIDAKASSITVEIKNGGIDLIRVTDNGVGIAKDQVEVAFLRHATSKITTAEDLYEVISLGFRGEALASIAAVSHVELLTKVKEATTGKRLAISGGKINESDEVACPDGTTFIMRHLFYNVPARKAFLNSSGTEAAKISDYMYKLALAHPEIAFKYIQNNKTVFTTSGDHELKHCVLNIYGREYAKSTFKCYYKSNDIECVGLLGAPSLNRSNRNYEHFFINGRYIKSSILQNAVEDAYKTLAMVGKFPFVILHLNMDPALVDVNVHPTKLQVRFKNVDLIYRIVYEAVSQTLKAEYLVPEVAVDKPRGDAKAQPVIETEQLGVETFFTPRKTENTVTAGSLLGGESNKHTHVIPETNPYKPSALGVERLFGPAPSEEEKKSLVSQTSTLPSQEEKIPIASVHPEGTGELKGSVIGEAKETSYDNTHKEIMAQEEVVDQVGTMISGLVEKEQHKQENMVEKQIQSYTHESYTHESYIHGKVEDALMHQEVHSVKQEKTIDYRIVGQLFKTYWLIQYHEKVFVIDQHAAHERVLYEQFMAYFKSGEIATQLLLMPETFNITPAEKILLEENEALFKKLGFIYEFFGEKSIVIREVPYLLNEPLEATIFKEILDVMSEQKISHIADVKVENIIRMSCRSAIKAHDQLSEKECQELIHALLALENPFTCPHGRPTLVALTQSDLEKMFKRI